MRIRDLFRKPFGRPAPRLRYRPVEVMVRRAPEQARIISRGGRGGR